MYARYMFTHYFALYSKLLFQNCHHLRHRDGVAEANIEQLLTSTRLVQHGRPDALDDVTDICEVSLQSSVLTVVIDRKSC